MFYIKLCSLICCGSVTKFLCMYTPDTPCLDIYYPAYMIAFFIQQLYDFKQFHWLTNYVILEYTHTDDVRGQRLTTYTLENIFTLMYKTNRLHSAGRVYFNRELKHATFLITRTSRVQNFVVKYCVSRSWFKSSTPLDALSRLWFESRTTDSIYHVEILYAWRPCC